MEQLLLLLHTNEPYNKTWHRATHKVLQHRLESNRIKMIVVKRLSDVQRLKVYHYSGTDRQTSIPLNGRTNVRMDGWMDRWCSCFLWCWCSCPHLFRGSTPFLNILVWKDAFLKSYCLILCIIIMITLHRHHHQQFQFRLDFDDRSFFKIRHNVIGGGGVSLHSIGILEMFKTLWLHFWSIINGKVGKWVQPHNFFSD